MLLLSQKGNSICVIAVTLLTTITKSSLTAVPEERELKLVPSSYNPVCSPPGLSLMSFTNLYYKRVRLLICRMDHQVEISSGL